MGGELRSPPILFFGENNNQAGAPKMMCTEWTWPSSTSLMLAPVWRWPSNSTAAGEPGQSRLIFDVNFIARAAKRIGQAEFAPGGGAGTAAG